MASWTRVSKGDDSMSAKISVFIPSYNQRAYIAEAIESVLNQTLRPFEIIIVDDCSTDGSQKIIEAYARAHPDLIRAFYQETNLGIPRNKNFALERVRGDLVTHLDGDDRFLPRKLEMELETFMNHPEAKIVYSNVYQIDANGARLRRWLDNTVLPPTGYVFGEVFGRTFPFNSTFRNEFVDYKSLKEVGFYDEAFPIYQVWDLKIRLTKRFKVAYCPEPLAEYRIHAGGISKSAASVHLNALRKIYEKNRALLNDVPANDRAMIKKGLFARFKHLASSAAWDEVEKGNKKRALEYFLLALRYSNLRECDYRLAARVLLPQWAYAQFRSVYRMLGRRPR